MGLEYPDCWDQVRGTRAQLDTDEFYRMSCERGFVKTEAIARNIAWESETRWGKLQITINLSKPEKDPAAIAEAAKLPVDDHCALCVTDADIASGYAVPLDINGEPWAIWYSPYAYYNEHCIAMSWIHRPMHIDRTAFAGLFDFSDQFPQYFIGSNADLPIVGGSILGHDHFQGGRHVFPMQLAGVDRPFAISGYPDVQAGVLKWPVSVVRLRGENRNRLIDVACTLLNAWAVYDDEACGIDSGVSAGQRHNTITPILRHLDGGYELDLALRCNVASEEHLLGVFHPHAHLHHIKKENIGLIEVMGLAILPPRLQPELEAVAEALLSGSDLYADDRTAPHAAWAHEVAERHPELAASNVRSILRDEVGIVFAQVLEDAGVFKWTDEGQAAFDRFLSVAFCEER